MNIREIGFFERLEELARFQPETTALVCEDKQLKYRELTEIILRLLNGMLEEGIEKGGTRWASHGQLQRISAVDCSRIQARFNQRLHQYQDQH